MAVVVTRAERRCPRTWPHEPHRWLTGVIFRAADIVTFDCPGVPLPNPKDGKQ